MALQVWRLSDSQLSQTCARIMFSNCPMPTKYGQHFLTLLPRVEIVQQKAIAIKKRDFLHAVALQTCAEQTRLNRI